MYVLMLLNCTLGNRGSSTGWPLQERNDANRQQRGRDRRRLEDLAHQRGRGGPGKQSMGNLKAQRAKGSLDHDHQRSGIRFVIARGHCSDLCHNNRSKLEKTRRLTSHGAKSIAIGSLIHKTFKVV